MKITRTNREFDTILGAIKAIAADKLSLPAKVGYQLSKNRIAIEDALRPYREANDEIVKKYAKDGENSFRINKDDDPKTFEEVSNAFREIGDEETTVDVVEISLSALNGHDIPFAYIDILCDILNDDE